MLTRRQLLFTAAATPVLALHSPIAAQAQAANAVPIATGLDHPWGVAFLPNGDALITERRGQLRLFSFANNALSDPIGGLPEIAAGGQGGLLGITIDPAFTENRRVYVSFTEPHGDETCTAVFRGELNADATALANGKTIFRQNLLSSGTHHFGSRLVFDREGFLFVTTGDRNRLRAEAQNPANHIGKILRITTDGSAAPGNPKQDSWAPEVWSIGHRNVQGATLHPETGQLWTAEHGAKGGDEINVPEAGKNYGWPTITYGRDYSGAKIGEGVEKAGLEQPLHYWDPSIAPSGMHFYTGDKYPDWKGSLFVGALAGEHLSRLTLDGRKVIAEEKLFEGLGRMRDIVQSPDGYLYMLVDASEPDGALLRITAPGDVTATPQ